MARSWAELRIHLAAEHLDVVANFLIEAGAPGVEVREGPDGAELVACFSGEPPVAALRTLLTDLAASKDAVSTRRIDDEAWAETWKHHCRPQRIGRRLYVCPSWETHRTPPGRLPIIIDPGMAFGTGDHPTTRNCLRLAERVAARGSLHRVLDCGSGSGILAIATVKLGALEAWAVDTDPTACDATAANGVRNGVAARLHVASSIDCVSGPFELVLANLYADLLEEMSSRLGMLLAPGAALICAGFLLTDADRVQRAFADAGLRVESRIEEDGWVTMQLRGAWERCPSPCS